MVVSLERATEILSQIFEKAGLSRTRAGQLAELFVTTEAKGVWSHGIGLTAKYTEQFLKGTINTEPNITVVRQYPSSMVLDGDRGLGVTVMEHAVDKAMSMARQNGIGCVTVTNLQHYAAGLYYAQLPADEGMIMLMVANAPKSMAPYGGSVKYYGTNPLTFAAPMGNMPIYCLDMATTVCAGNKLEHAANFGQQVAEGLGLDRYGNPSKDPLEILKYGSLLPFGGAKGSGIAGMVNIMAGILSGAAYRDDVISLCRDKAKPSNYGSCLIMLDISKFMDYQEYSERAQIWANDILNNPPAKGFDKVIYPGYAEGMRWIKAKESGLELSEIGLKSLKTAGSMVGLDMEKLIPA